MIALLIAGGIAFATVVLGTPVLIRVLRQRGIGQLIRDDHGLALLSSLPSGSYKLIAGLYDGNGVRLAANEQDHVELGTVMVR